MSSSTPPWRVIEAPGTPGGATKGASDPAAGGAGSMPLAGGVARRPAIVAAAAIAAAVVMVLVAVLVATGSQRGMVEVRAAGATPRTSGVPAGSAASGPASAGTDGIVVEVAGAVVRPGVYTLPRGARVGDAIAAAGGYSPRVAADQASLQLNLAAPLKDGQQVRVPSRDDAIPAPSAGGGGSGTGLGGSSTAPLDLNRATAAELEGLPGIGPATAARILASRAERPFATVDDLLERKLVSARVLEQIRPLVVVR